MSEERSVVDIGKAANEFTVYSPGDIERLDQEKKVTFRWHKAKVILWLSTFTIVSILLSSLGVLAFSTDESSRDWARQTLTVLVGFGAGAIWTSAQKGSDDRD